MGTHAQAESVSSAEVFDPGDRWVPVDRRWWGIDRRTLLPALVVLALAFLQGVVLPRIDDAIPVAVTTAGDVIALKGGFTFTADGGWSLVEGELVGDEPTGRGYPDAAVLTRGGTQFTVRTGTFAGDSAALLDQIEQTQRQLGSALTATGDPVAVTTLSGESGVMTRYAAPQMDGVLAAFVIDGTGVEIIALGPEQAGQDILTDVGAMIATLTHTGKESS
ncbi:hypothetical protein OG308_32195 [Nocardia salmonicida]|uniref:Uncharacterized protein n=1 Tax=Nocardia salmonicida TaxID=53431 RepID=A0ABZ1N7W5_9NOCA